MGQETMHLRCTLRVYQVKWIVGKMSEADFEVNIHKTQNVRTSLEVDVSKKCTPLRRSQVCSVFQVICFEKERSLAEFLFFLCGPLGEIKKEVIWDKQVFNFANRRIGKETNSKSILSTNKSIDKYILQQKRTIYKFIYEEIYWWPSK